MPGAFRACPSDACENARTSPMCLPGVQQAHPFPSPDLKGRSRMAVSHAFPSLKPRDDERYYLPPRILAAVRREAVACGADDWASYAQDKLDRELLAC